MSVLYLTESDVRQLLPMEAALRTTEAAFRKLACDEAINIPRTRCQTDHVMLHVLPAAAKTIGYVGYKAYTTTQAVAKFWYHLYHGKTGEWLAIIEADHLGRLRTGAASGIATRLLARPEADTLGILGSGKQALTQATAVCAVRSIRRVEVYARDEAKRLAFADELRELVTAEVFPVTSAELAVRDKAIVCTATSTRTPIVQADWLTPGQHWNVAGSNFLAKAELDAATVGRFHRVVVDSREQARLEAGDFRDALEKKVLLWSQVEELSRLVAGRAPGRESAEELTLFKSVGIGMEDLTAAGFVYDRAREAGIGRTLDC